MGVTSSKQIDAERHIENTRLIRACDPHFCEYPGVILGAVEQNLLVFAGGSQHQPHGSIGQTLVSDAFSTFG